MVAEVPYVEQVINEVLRIYPPAVRYINITKIEVYNKTMRYLKDILIKIINEIICSNNCENMHFFNYHC